MRITRRRRWWLAILVAAGILFFAYCVHMVRFYPTYKGQVLNLQTGKPLNGAQVVAVYLTEKKDKFGITVPEFLGCQAVWTGTDGRFTIPSRSFWRILVFGRYREHPKVEIYKPGYGNYPAILNDPEGDMIHGPPGWTWPAGALPPGSDVTFSLPRLNTKDDRKRWGSFGIILLRIPEDVRKVLEEQGFEMEH